MSEKNLHPTERDNMLGELAKKETEFIRFRRLRLTHNEFENIKLIGRGAFGEVRNPLLAGWLSVVVCPLYSSLPALDNSNSNLGDVFINFPQSRSCHVLTT